MKEVLLVDMSPGAERPVLECETIAEAQAIAEESMFDEAQIYTLFSSGVRARFEWALNTDHVANVTENKKAEKQRKGTWTRLEMDALEYNISLKMPITEIAVGLKRTYNSTYLKAKALSLI